VGVAPLLNKLIMILMLLKPDMIKEPALFPRDAPEK